MVVVVVGGGGLEQFSVSPGPLGFGFGTKKFGAKGLGPGLDNKYRFVLQLWVMFHIYFHKNSSKI